MGHLNQLRTAVLAGLRKKLVWGPVLPVRNQLGSLCVRWGGVHLRTGKIWVYLLLYGTWVCSSALVMQPGDLVGLLIS